MRRISPSGGRLLGDLHNGRDGVGGNDLPRHWSDNHYHAG